MGHIKEPYGVDFIINSRPLTKVEESAISGYIKAYKKKNNKKEVPTKRIGRITSGKKLAS